MRIQTLLVASSLLLGGSLALPAAPSGSPCPSYKPPTADSDFYDPPPQNTSGKIGTPGRIPADNPPPKPNPYLLTGDLTEPEPMPYQPAGGINTKPTDIPVYEAMSDFDWHSLALGVHQEYIELDLFLEGLRRFSDEEFEAAGLGAADRALIKHMSDQEIGHAAALSNMLGPNSPKPCEYQYPFSTVREFIDFCQALTRWGEAGVYGFLPHMDSREAAQIVLQSITTEARQQYTFRQFEGLFPMPEWHQVGFTQSMQWTLLAPWIKSCPPENKKLPWANFPALDIVNNPQANDTRYNASISTLRPHLSYPGREVEFVWETPGKKVGPNNSYVTDTVTKSEKPAWAGWIAQLNVTYTPLYDVEKVDEDRWTGKAKQPDGVLWDVKNPLLNGTSFVVLTDVDLFVTPHNMTLLNNHVVAGPAVYMAD